MIDFTQTILQNLFRGFIFDEEVRRVLPNLQVLNGNYLLKIGKEECGYTEKQAKEHIQDTIDNVSGVLDFTNSRSTISCSLSDLQPYSMIRIHHDGPSLTLLYLEGCHFWLLKDDFHALLPGDRLQCWTYTLSVGHEAIFRVIRDGKPYPDEKQVLKTHRIEAIELLQPIFLPMPDNRKKPSVPPIMGERFIYVGEPRATAEGYVFLPQDFTNHDKTMFMIDLKRLEFSLNPDFDQSLYSHSDRNYVDVLCTICDYTVEQEKEKRRKTIVNGKMEVVNMNDNQYALRIYRKAIVTL